MKQTCEARAVAANVTDSRKASPTEVLRCKLPAGHKGPHSSGAHSWTTFVDVGTKIWHQNGTRSRILGRKVRK